MIPVQADLLEDWRRLWVNRSQPFALQRSDGTYRWVHRPITDALLCSHLAGDVTLALSSTDARGWCRWLCLDVDTPDTLPQLLALRLALAGRGLPGLVEASRRRGHLWLFLEAAAPAIEARWTLLEVCEQLRAAQECAIPTHELYPNASVAGALGHPVRLPLGIHRLTGTRYPLFDAEGHPCAFTSPEAALRFVLATPHVPVETVQHAWRRFLGSGSVAAVPPDTADTGACSPSWRPRRRCVASGTGIWAGVPSTTTAPPTRWAGLALPPSMSSAIGATAGVGAASPPTARTRSRLCATVSAYSRSCVALMPPKRSSRPSSVGRRWVHESTKTLVRANGPWLSVPTSG